jgi:phosphoglycerate dehydrogenase-like enzyme
MALRVGVLDDYQNAAREFGPWSELGNAADVTIFNDHVTGTGSLVERLAPFDVIVAMRERTRFPRQVLERLPRLRLLVSTGMGTAHIDVAAASELGITVSGTGGRPAPAAELTWALILGLARHAGAEDAGLRAGSWGQTVGTDLAGLDVFDIEPLPADHPLRTAPRTLLTPHIGYVTAGSYQAFYGGAVEAILAFLAGHPIRLLTG